MAEEEKSYTQKKSEGVHKAVEKAQEEQEAAKKKRSLIQAVTYYALPLVSIAVFIGVLVIGTIPSIKSILNRYNELKGKQEEIVGLEGEIESLEELKANESQITSDLAIIDSIVPSAKTQVAKFVGEIDTLAQEHSLAESSYESGEQIQQLEEEIEEQSEGEAALIHIPTNSAYIATFDNIKNFLSALYEKKDFIIVSELIMQGRKAREYIASQQLDQGELVTIDTSLSSVDWTMEVTFEKYQFGKGFAQYIGENLVPISADPNEETLEYIRSRYSE